jgi:hypothetical protein
MARVCSIAWQSRQEPLFDKHDDCPCQTMPAPSPWGDSAPHRRRRPCQVCGLQGHLRCYSADMGEKAREQRDAARIGHADMEVSVRGRGSKLDSPSEICRNSASASRAGSAAIHWAASKWFSDRVLVKGSESQPRATRALLLPMHRFFCSAGNSPAPVNPDLIEVIDVVDYWRRQSRVVRRSPSDI